MATRSYICIQADENDIRAIYCHYDGYPSHVGSLLMKHYNTLEKVEELIALGDISLLGPHLAPVKEYDSPRYVHMEDQPVRHTFKIPQRNVTVAYHRDGGEGLSIHKFYFESQLHRQLKKGTIEYYYLFKNEQWHVNGTLLTEEICENY